MDNKNAETIAQAVETSVETKVESTSTKPVEAQKPYVKNRTYYGAGDLRVQLRARVKADIIMHPERYDESITQNSCTIDVFAHDFAKHFIEKCDAKQVRVLNELTADALYGLTGAKPSIKSLYDLLYQGGVPELSQPGEVPAAPKFKGC
jgi:hypothetical protein